MKPKVVVIVGPTASGKSDLAVKLAKRFDGEIISADSRQVYKGLNIGTGKITKREMGSIPHYLLDVADPKKKFTVSEYKKLAEKALYQIRTKHKLPIVVGGTGFYIDIVTHNSILPEVSPNEILRKKLSEKSTEELFQELQKKDPERAKTIDRKNKVRLIRALEIIEELGTVPILTDAVSEYEFIYIGLAPKKEALEKQMYTRLMRRLPGMIREGKQLHEKGLSWKRMEELGLEYRYLARYLQKKLTKEEMTNELYTEIKHYSKRQMTWFKRNKKIQWFTPEQSAEIETYLETKI